VNKIFPILLFVVSVLIAGTAAFFSVRGIGLLFAGSFMPVVIMASSLEIGKLFAVSFLYRKWDVMPKLLRFYLSIATILLIIITSLGIFGFLSDAYQDTRNKVSFYDTKIQSIEEHNTALRKQIETRQQAEKSKQNNTNVNVDRYKSIYDDFVKQQNQTKQSLVNRVIMMDEQMNTLKGKTGLFSNTAKKIEALETQQSEERGRIKTQLLEIESRIKAEYESFLSKVDLANNTQQESLDVTPLLKKIEDNNNQILELRSSVNETDIGSFRFIANAFDIETDTAVKWFIIMIVVVFDPLAMCLVVGYNVYVIGPKKVAGQPLIPTSVVNGKKRVLIRPKNKS